MNISIVSYRLGEADGVSVEADKWRRAFESLGHRVSTVAGRGVADVLIEGLSALGDAAPDPGQIEAAFAGADVVVVENLCSLPLRVEPGEAVAAALRGRPAVLRHHDLPWHRPQLAHLPPPPDDAVWLHVCTSDHSRLELAARGIGARTLRNRFETAPAPGDRARMRRALGVAAEERLILQPTRAIARKNVRAGIDLAAATGSVYWLLGRAEDGYETELDELFSRARRSGVPLRHRWPPTAEADADPPLSMADAYAGCDVVALPSTWEGFGNPALESATHGRPLVIGDYPASRELRAFGFHWFGPEDHRLVADFLAQPDDRLLAANAAVARRHFDLAALPGELEALLSDLRQPLRGVSGNP